MYRILCTIVNEYSDQYRTPKATKIRPCELEKLASKVADASSSCGMNLVTPEL